MLSRFDLRVTVAAAVLAALSVSACEQVPLGAPSESLISVAAGASSLPPGGSTEITAFVVEQAGTAVHNGTLVRFTATMGTVNPLEVETKNGFATTRFTAANMSGIARIRATSGSATGGTGDTPSNQVEIAVGGAVENATVLVNASPTRVSPNGGTVTLTASVLDGSGNRLTGVPVTFTTTAGTLSASAATTDVSGNATVQLTTNREATVTATAAGKNATARVEVAPVAGVTLALDQVGGVVAGSPITLTVTPAPGTTPRVVVEWGDGRSDNLGVLTGPRSVAHTYNEAGSYTITAIATADGETFTTSTAVTIRPRGAISVSVSSDSTSVTTCQAVKLTVTAPEATGATFSWVIQNNNNSSDREEFATTGTVVTLFLKTPGLRTVLVTANTPDGRSGSGSTQFNVTSGATTCQTDR